MLRLGRVTITRTPLILIGCLAASCGGYAAYAIVSGKESIVQPLDIEDLPAALQIAGLEFWPTRGVVDAIEYDRHAGDSGVQVLFIWQLLATKSLSPPSTHLTDVLDILWPNRPQTSTEELLDLVSMAKGDQPVVAILPSPKPLDEAVASGRYRLELGPSGFIGIDTSECGPLYGGCWAPPMPGFRVTSAIVGEKRRRLAISSTITKGMVSLSPISSEPFEFELDDGSTAVIPLLIRARDKSPQTGAAKSDSHSATPRYYRDMHCLLALTMQLCPLPAAAGAD